MDNQDQTYLSELRKCWNSEEHLKAGKLIFEGVPPDARPRWAARILRLVLDKSGLDQSPFTEVLTAAEHVELWKTGHDVFSRLRAHTLRLNEIRLGRGLSKHEELFAFAFRLAEFVAKVIYNATNPSDEFDEDSGWYIASYLRAFVDQYGNESFADAAWQAVSTFE